MRLVSFHQKGKSRFAQSACSGAAARGTSRPDLSPRPIRTFRRVRSGPFFCSKWVGESRRAPSLGSSERFGFDERGKCVFDCVGRHGGVDGARWFFRPSFRLADLWWRLASDRRNCFKPIRSHRCSAFRCACRLRVGVDQRGKTCIFPIVQGGIAPAVADRRGNPHPFLIWRMRRCIPVSMKRASVFCIRRNGLTASSSPHFQNEIDLSL